MKRFMEITVQFKFVWGLMFTAAILLYSIVSMFMGKTSMDFVLIWQFVAITMLLVFIHFLIFGEFILKSLRTKYKIAIHFLSCYATGLISVSILNWVNLSKISTIGIFTGAYTLIYLAMCFSLYMYYKGTGEQLNDRLAAYKQNKKSREAGK